MWYYERHKFVSGDSGRQSFWVSDGRVGGTLWRVSEKERRRCKTCTRPWYPSISQAKGQGIQTTTMGEIPLYADVLLFGELIDISSYFNAGKWQKIQDIRGG